MFQVAALLLLGLAPWHLRAQTQADFFDDSVLNEIRLRLHPADWERLRANIRDNTYYQGQLEWRGLVVQDIGIRSRGWSTRNPEKPGLRLDFNRYEQSQQFLGLKSLTLDNLVQDAAAVKERVSMYFFRRMGMPAPLETHARLYVNDQYIGLYGVVESVDKVFLKRNFGDDSGYLYEYRPREGYRFEYLGPDLSVYSPGLFEPRTHETNPDPAPLEAMVRVMNQSSDAEFPRAMAEYLDLKLFINYLATENFLGDFGGILANGWMENNFYLYRFKGKNLFYFIPWDKDLTFQEGRSVWTNVNQNVLVRRALAVPELRRAYLEALVKCVVLTGALSGWLEQEIERGYNQIRGAAREDTRKQCGYKPCSNEEFEEEVTRILRYARERADFVRSEVAQAGFELSGEAPGLNQGGIVSAASAGGALTPGSLASLYGERLGVTTAVAASLPLSATLDGVSVVVNGFAAPLLFVSPTQVNVQAPWEVRPGRAPVTAIVNGTVGNTVTADVTAVSPGIFVVVHADGAVVSAERPAAASELIVAFATGLGPVSSRVSTGWPAPAAPLAITTEAPVVTVGGALAEVLFSGLTPGFVGLYQINIRAPAGLKPAVGVSLVVSMGGQAGASALIATR